MRGREGEARRKKEEKGRRNKVKSERAMEKETT